MGGSVDVDDTTTFTVTFNLNGGTFPEPIEPRTGLNYGAGVDNPGNPIREPLGWFEFTGWYSNIDLTREWCFDTDRVFYYTTLFARWELTADAGNIGDTGPCGYGTIFYRRDEGFVMADTNERAFFLVVSSADGTLVVPWAVALDTYFPPVPGMDGERHRLIPGLSRGETDETDWAVGRGRLNTALIVKYGASGVAGCYTPFNTPAATHAYGYTGGGLTDWFLPSKHELTRLHEVRIVSNIDIRDNGLQQNDPKIYLGPLGNYWWSSSQWNLRGTHAWARNFHNNHRGFIGSAKGNSGQRARPIRAF